MAVIKIVKGDTLKGLANLLDISLVDILNLNRNIKNVNLIQVGQSLNLPDTPAVRSFAAGRSLALNPPINNSRGDWGVYQPDVELPKMTIKASKLNEPENNTNKYLIIGAILLALLLSRKK